MNNVIKLKQKDEYKDKYFELLYEVINKVDGETRHETAKRIINQNQTNTNEAESNV